MTDLSSIRALTVDLAAHPIQAFNAYLSNIEPMKDSWGIECASTFAEMVSEEFLYAHFVESKVIFVMATSGDTVSFCNADFVFHSQHGPVLGVEIIDTKNEYDVIINQKLIELGYAKRK